MTLSSVPALLRGEQFEIFGYEGEGWFDSFARKPLSPYDGEFNFDRISSLIKKDSVCLDVGANMGFWSLILAGIASEGKVHSFEASPRLLAALQKTVEASGRKNIEIHAGVIGKAGSEGLFIEENDYLSSSHYIPFKNGAEVAKTIDSLELPRADFIKIDVEGSELDVLEGAIDTIKRCSPIVIVEFNSFAMVHYRELIPRAVLNRICEIFSTVGCYPDKSDLVPGLLSDKEAFLKYNMLNGHVHDLICMNATA